MSFLWPAMLALLLLLPPGIALYIRAHHRRLARAAGYGSMGMLQAVAGAQLGRRRHLPPALFLAGLAILIVGTARPQATVSLPRVAGTVMLTFDVSGSMVATDQEPSRMEAAKAAARALVEGRPQGVDIGVVAFSDGGLTVQAPTDDVDAVLSAISRIEPQRGTSLGQGIAAALTALTEAPDTPTPAAGEAAPIEGDDATAPRLRAPSTIVLFSDGENTGPPDPLEAAAAAQELGVRIHTVGIGTADGADIEVEGFRIRTRLDEAALQQIADLTDGAYFGVARQAELDAVYQSLARQLLVEPEMLEVTALFAGLGILVLLAGGLLSLLWFGRMP